MSAIKKRDSLGAFSLLLVFFSVFFFTLSFSSAALTDGLVGYWTFEEGSGTATADSSGNGYSGTLVNGAGWGVGKIGSFSLNFDGVDDMVRVTNNALDNVNTYTYCAWVFPVTQGQTGDGRIVHKGTSSSRKQLQFIGGTTGSIGMTVNRATGEELRSSPANTLVLNVWQHICGTYSEATGPRVYRNGVEVTSGSTSSGGATSDDSGDDMYFGNRGSGGRAFEGMMDDIRVYNRILTPTELTQLYDLGTTPDTTPPGFSAISVSAINSTSATINWNTNEAANSTVEFGTTTSYGSSIHNAALVTTRSIVLNGLSPSTLYHYRLRSGDLSGNVNVTGDFTFTTTAPPPDTTPPTIFNGLPANLVPAFFTDVNISVETTENSTCRYSLAPNVPYASMTSTFSITGRTTHMTNIGGIVRGPNTYNVRCIDAAGNPTASDFVVRFTLEAAGTGATFARRVAPLSYTPGTPILVTLNYTFASADCGGSIEEYLPTGWSVSNIQGPGIWNATYNVIKWGPLYSALCGGLNNNITQYTLTPPSSATSIAVLRGFFSVDGLDYPISGTSALTGQVGSDVTPPVLFNGQPSGTSPSGTTTMSLNFTTDELALCRFSTTANTPYGSMNTMTFLPLSPPEETPVAGAPAEEPQGFVETLIDFVKEIFTSFLIFGHDSITGAAVAGEQVTSSATGGTHHQLMLSGLTNGITYPYYFKCSDQAGNNNTLDFTITFTVLNVAGDITPPALLSIASSAINASSATISWNTNEAANSTVEYGTSVSYGSFAHNSALVTTRSIVLNGLSPSTLYHYRVKSSDASGNTNTSGDLTFTTLALADITPPALLAISVSSITTSNATISWNTNENANSTLEYGLTTAYGSFVHSAASVTTRSLVAPSLTASTLYHYRVKSSDLAGNTNTSGDFTFTTLSVPNTAPTISSIVAQSTNEDTTLGPLAFTIGDAETSTSALILSTSSSNQTVVPNANLILGGSAASRNIQFRPGANQSGGTTIEINVSDGNLISTMRFGVTVIPVNDNPYFNVPLPPSTLTFNEDSSGSFTILMDDIDTPLSVVNSTVSIADTTIIPQSGVVITGNGNSRLVTITPAPNRNGTTTGTITLADGVGFANRPISFTVNPINDDPTITPIAAQTTNEDTSIGPLAFTIGDVDNTLASLTLGTDSSNQTVVPLSGIALSGSGSSRSVTITPAANQSGTTVVTINVNDGIGGTNATTFLVSVSPVNDGPSITAITGRFTTEDTPLTGIGFTVNDLDTPLTSLSVFGTSSNPTLIADTNIQVSGSGASRTVSVTPNANQFGSATITLNVSDGSMSAVSSFLLTVTGVNDAPNISSVSNITTTMNTPVGPLSFTISDNETLATALSVTAASFNTSLIANANISLGGTGTVRTIAFTPSLNRIGNGLITIAVSDGTASTSTTFGITVTFVNSAPTVSALADQTINEDTSVGQLSFTITDDNFATVVVTTNSSNQSVIPLSGITLGGSGANRDVTIRPATNQSGQATVSVIVDDGQYKAIETLLVTVNAVNDAPMITTLSDVNTNEDTSVTTLPFSISDVDNTLGQLTVSATSSNLALIPLNGITVNGAGASRTITLVPTADQSGSATITVTVGDGASSTQKTFNAVVTAVNDRPLLSLISNQTINEDVASASINFVVSDVDTPLAQVSVQPDSDNQTLLPNSRMSISGTSSTRTLTLSPTPDQSGLVSVILRADDGQGGTDQIFFGLRVNAINDAPTISNILDQTTTRNNQTSLIPFTINDIDNATLIVTATSSNQALVSAADITLGGTGTIRTIQLTPLADQSGQTTITVTVSDGTSSVTDTFVLNVVAVNTAPTISSIANQVTQEDITLSAVPFTITDLDTPATSLSLSVSSSDTAIVPVSRISFGGSDTARTITLTPGANQSGTSVIEVNVSDGQYTSSQRFTLSVTAVNDAPMIRPIPAITILEDDMVHLNVAAADLTQYVTDIDSPLNTIEYRIANSVPSSFSASIGMLGTGYQSRSDNTFHSHPVADFSGVTPVTIQVRDATGAESNQVTFTYTITPVNDAPTAQLSIAPQSGFVGQPVSFDASASSDIDSSLLSYVWNFGNGQGANGVTTQYTYSTAGIYTVAVNVSDGSLSQVATQSLTISALPDTTMPHILNTSITFPSTTSAQIVVDFDELVDMALDYGLTTNYTQTRDSAGLVRHTFNLTGLTSDTLYYAQFVYGDLANNINATEFTFRTPAIVDSDGDGVINQFDLCPSTPNGISVNRYGCPLPLFSKFSASLTTNFSDVNLVNLSTFDVGIVNLGQLSYTGSNITLLNGNQAAYSALDLNALIDFVNRAIIVRSESFRALNFSARVTLYNLSSITSPNLLRDGIQCTDCRIVRFGSGELVFVVPHFTNYTVVEGSYCGDSFCSVSESCSVCENDCGRCTSSTPSSGGGGGGGGGSNTPRPVVNSTINQNPNQTPVEQTPTEETPSEETPAEEEVPSEVVPEGLSNALKSSYIGAIVALVLAISFVIYLIINTIRHRPIELDQTIV